MRISKKLLAKIDKELANPSAETRRLWKELDEQFKREVQPLIDKIRDSERLTAADYAIVINAR